MNLYEEFRTSYLKSLDELIATLKTNEGNLRSQNRFDDSILEKIKTNVVEIFYKMFEVSYNNVYKKLSIKNLEDAVNSSSDQNIQLYNAYMVFFEKIPAPWRDKMDKDKLHNMMDEYYKECLKLETVDKIKSLFIKHFNNTWGDING